MQLNTLALMVRTAHRRSVINETILINLFLYERFFL